MALKWYPSIIAFLISSALISSLLSSFDCKFLQLKIGFVPSNLSTLMRRHGDTPFGIGLWTFEYPNPDNDPNLGDCVAYNQAGEIGLLSDGSSKIYIANSWFGGTDALTNASRIMAIFSVFFSGFSFLFIWVSLIFASAKMSKGLKRCLLGLILGSVISETCKLFLFFQSDLCKAKIWQYEQTSGGISLESSNSCPMARGSVVSFFSASISFMALLMVGVHVTCYKEQDDQDVYESSGGFGYDDITLPSFLNSIGESLTTSKSSKSGVSGTSTNYREIQNFGSSMRKGLARFGSSRRSLGGNGYEPVNERMKSFRH